MIVNMNKGANACFSLSKQEHMQNWYTGATSEKV